MGTDKSARKWWGVGVALALGGAAPVSAQRGPIEIGRDITNSLVFHLEESLPLPMDVSVLPQHPGFAREDLGIESLQVMNKHEHFPIASASDVRLMLVPIDPGLKLYDGAAAMAPGQEMALGAPFFHVTPLWTIDPAPVGGVYGARLRVRDAAGLQGPSGVFEVTFQTVPGPGALTVLGIGMLGRRRR